MQNFTELKPNTVIGEADFWALTLEAWKGFQSRQGYYGSQDKEDVSDGKVKASVEGKEVADIKTTTQEQINAINYLIDNSYAVRDALLTGLLNELPKLREIYEELIPDVKNIEEFKNILGLGQIHVMDADKDGFAYIGFELGCIWDDEHGVGVMMHKERVIEIGQADTSFDSWVTYDDNGTTEIETEKWHKANAKLQEERRKNS